MFFKLLGDLAGLLGDHSGNGAGLSRPFLRSGLDLSVGRLGEIGNGINNLGKTLA
jgi:hypothetical protein